jgi:hypothetical protein
MEDNKLLAAIMLRQMMPSTGLMKPKEKTGRYDLKDLTRVGPIVTSGLQTLRGMTSVMAHDHQQRPARQPIDSRGTKIMNDNEIIAALITSGMLPTLPPAKLHDVAKGSKSNTMQQSAEIVASALALYTAVLSMLGTLDEHDVDNESAT